MDKILLTVIIIEISLIGLLGYIVYEGFSDTPSINYEDYQFTNEHKQIFNTEKGLGNIPEEYELKEYNNKQFIVHTYWEEYNCGSLFSSYGTCNRYVKQYYYPTKPYLEGSQNKENTTYKYFSGKGTCIEGGSSSHGNDNYYIVAGYDSRPVICSDLFNNNSYVYYKLDGWKRVI